MNEDRTHGADSAIDDEAPPVTTRADVAPVDRELFITLFRLPERVHARVRGGEKDGDAEMLAIARHRVSAL